MGRQRQNATKLFWIKNKKIHKQQSTVCQRSTSATTRWGITQMKYTRTKTKEKLKRFMCGRNQHQNRHHHHHLNKSWHHGNQNGHKTWEQYHDSVEVLSLPCTDTNPIQKDKVFFFLIHLYICIYIAFSYKTRIIYIYAYTPILYTLPKITVFLSLYCSGRRVNVACSKTWQILKPVNPYSLSKIDLTGWLCFQNCTA